MGPICNGCWVWSNWSVVAHFTRDGVNNTGNSHLWDSDNPYGTVESNYQHRFSVNVWCGVVSLVTNLLVLIYLQRLTGDIYASVLQDQLPALLENVPLQTRRQMCYQHDRAQPHCCQVVRQYQNHKFPNQWTSRGGDENWPPQSPDLNPLDYHVWSYMKAMVYACGVHTSCHNLSDWIVLCVWVSERDRQAMLLLSSSLPFSKICGP